jgi:hypothetical protein
MESAKCRPLGHRPAMREVAGPLCPLPGSYARLVALDVTAPGRSALAAMRAAWAGSGGLFDEARVILANGVEARVGQRRANGRVASRPRTSQSAARTGSAARSGRRSKATGRTSSGDGCEGGVLELDHEATQRSDQGNRACGGARALPRDFSQPLSGDRCFLPSGSRASLHA